MNIIEKVKNFFDNRKDKKLEKAAKVIKNAKAIKEDRQAAIEFLGYCGELEAAIPALLARFDYSLEHGINDSREKELTMSAILRYELDCTPFVMEHIKASDRIAWPVKILKKLDKEEEVKEALLGCLKYEDVSFDHAAVNKNYDVLCYLRDYDVGPNLKELSQFLSDQDERVRFAAAELLIDQNHAEVSKYLEPFLKDETSENRRIKQVAARAFTEKGWEIVDVEVLSLGTIEGVFVVDPSSKTLRPQA